ncbi:ABC transporter ATP-binding protein [Pseudolabrys sp. FHR47]|uniref:ABC transporter ATP-binding protein n=1 Tax=Pseudolabrys sp. FHR47 TaxID=2562284 RepID=UPI0010BF6092|nr:ABC transporter ATP-binding protein [Pseudolabrys sp. FHR47]
MRLDLEGLGKHFEGVFALENISLSVEAPEFVCLLGPSGCGKTTLLRLIAGLTTPDEGRIMLDGADLSAVPARERGFGIVFQAYSLFPNMTVAANVGYGLRIRGVAPAKIAARVAELLELTQLPHLADRYPWQLSGGQQQRVALARAVAVEPKLLLLDEPLSALDAKVRVELRAEIRALQRRLGILTIMVTHDQEEAMSLADRIVCMQKGRIAQVGTAQELYHHPASRFVADFMGVSNLIDLKTAERYAPALLADRRSGDGDIACVRPEDVIVGADGPQGADARVASVQFLGNISRLVLDWPGGELIAEQPGETALQPGAEVTIGFAANKHAWVANS